MNFFGGGRVTPAEAAMRDAVFKATTPTEGGEGDPASLLVVQQLLQFGTTQESDACIKHVKARIKSDDAAVQVTSLVVLDRLLQLGDPRFRHAVGAKIVPRVEIMAGSGGGALRYAAEVQKAAQAMIAKWSRQYGTNARLREFAMAGLRLQGTGLIPSARAPAGTPAPSQHPPPAGVNQPAPAGVNQPVPAGVSQPAPAGVNQRAPRPASEVQGVVSRAGPGEERREAAENVSPFYASALRSHERLQGGDPSAGSDSGEWPPEGARDSEAGSRALQGDVPQPWSGAHVPQDTQSTQRPSAPAEDSEECKRMTYGQAKDAVALFNTILAEAGPSEMPCEVADVVATRCMAARAWLREQITTSDDEAATIVFLSLHDSATQSLERWEALNSSAAPVPAAPQAPDSAVHSEQSGGTMPNSGSWEAAENGTQTGGAAAQGGGGAVSAETLARLQQYRLGANPNVQNNPWDASAPTYPNEEAWVPGHVHARAIDPALLSSVFDAINRNVALAENEVRDQRGGGAAQENVERRIARLHALAAQVKMALKREADPGLLAGALQKDVRGLLYLQDLEMLLP